MAADDDAKVWVRLAAILVLVSLVPALIWSGYVTTVLWQWFVAEPFGVRPISIPLALGLSLILSRFFWGVARTKEFWKLLHPERSAAMHLTYTVVDMFAYPTFALGIGWVIKGFL